MKNTTPVKNNENVITVVIDRSQISRGHQTHRSGVGKHADRRTARNRTRSQKNKNALRDW